MDNMRKRSFKKRTSTVIVSLVIIALFITGTFAVFVTSRAINEFKNKEEISGQDDAQLHDDFDPNNPFVNKDVYVTNTSTKEDSAIYVRIMLQEYMDLTSDKRPSNIDELWTTHKPSPQPPEVMHHEDCNNANAKGKKFHDNFKWEWGGTKIYKTGQGLYSDAEAHYEYARDNTVYTAANPPETQWTQGGKEHASPLDTNVVSRDWYASWSTAEKDNYQGWIYDSDGWAYWSQPLMGGTATGLLLDKVTLANPALADSTYYYAINVLMEAINSDDAGMWLNGDKSVDGKTPGNHNDDIGYGEATEPMKPIIEEIIGRGPSGDNPVVDKSALVSAIAKGEKLDTTGAPKNLVDDLEAAIDEGKAVLADKNATQPEVDAATKKIEDAIFEIEESLKKPLVDKSALEKAIADGEKLDTTGAPKNLVDDLEAAIDEGKTVMADEDATQAQVDAATKKIKDAILAIEDSLKVDKSELEEAITDAGKLDTTGNAKDLVDDLNSAVSKGEKVLNDNDATQAEVDAAAKEIKDAMDALNNNLKLNADKMDTDPNTNAFFYSSLIWIDGTSGTVVYDTESNGINTEAQAYGYVPLNTFLSNTDIAAHPVTVNIKTTGIPQDAITVGQGVDVSLRNDLYCKNLTGVSCLVFKYLPDRATIRSFPVDSDSNRYTNVQVTLTQDGKTSEEISLRITFSGAA